MMVGVMSEEDQNMKFHQCYGKMASFGRYNNQIKNGALEKIEFHETDHFKLLRDFYLYPDGFMQEILYDDDEFLTTAE